MAVSRVIFTVLVQIIAGNPANQAVFQPLLDVHAPLLILGVGSGTFSKPVFPHGDVVKHRKTSVWLFYLGERVYQGRSGVFVVLIQ